MKIELKTSRWFLLLHLPSSGRLQFGDYKCSRWGRWLIPVPAVCRLCVQRARRRGCESAGASLCARYVRILVFRKQKHLCAYVRLEQRQTSRWVTRWYVCIFKFKEPPLGVQVKETVECLLDSHVSTCNVTCSILGGRPRPTLSGVSTARNSNRSIHWFHQKDSKIAALRSFHPRDRWSPKPRADVSSFQYLRQKCSAPAGPGRHYWLQK